MMIAEFKVSNYRSIKDEQTLSLIATTEESKKEHSVAIDKYNILKSIVIYGPNASGKSNLIKALQCMTGFVSTSATNYKPNDKIPVVPFAFDKNSVNEPTSFEVTIFIDNVRYQYGFSATQERIYKEYLYSWPKGRSVLLFDRNGDNGLPYFGSALKGKNKDIWTLVNEKTLFLSVAAKFNNRQLEKVYNWFDFETRNLYDDRMPIKSVTDSILMDTEEGSEIRTVLYKILLASDLGFDHISVTTKDVEPAKLNLSESLPQEIRKAFIEGMAIERKTFHCNQKYVLDFEEESDGTKTFYKYIGTVIDVIRRGHLIIKDELETNLHPVLLRELVEFFNFSKSQAQIIFTTHDTTLLDPELFGRDQIYFTEKEAGTEQTNLYSLVEYNVRKDEAFQKRYLSGRYGAIPIIERFSSIEKQKDK